MDALPHLQDFPLDEQAILLGILFDRMPMGVAIFDRKQVLQRCNPTWADFIKQYCSQSVQQVKRGMSLAELAPGNDAVFDALVKRILTGESVQQEAMPLVMDGSAAFLDVTALPIFENGSVTSFLLVTVDATQRVQNIQELRSIAETLRQSERNTRTIVDERTRELAALNAIAAVVSRSLDLGEILHDALSKTLEVTGMELGLAYSFGEAEPGETEAPLQLAAQVGRTAEFLQFTGHLPQLRQTIHRAAAQHRPVTWPVALEQQSRETGVERDISTVDAVTVPLIAKDKSVGAIVLAARQPHAFADDEISLLAAIGQQIGVAVENAHLRAQAEQSAAMAERNRLARELHDSVTQSLYSVTLYAEAANRLLASGKAAEAAEHVRELRDTAQEALREMRLLIFELRPLALEKIGLEAAIRMRLESVEARGGLHTEFNVQGIEGLPLPLQEELYQIITEALNNLLKHAHAQHVTIQLTGNEDALKLRIIDDGIGFDPAAAGTSGGFGLAGMRERAQRLGGLLEMASQPGRGTRISLSAPGVKKPQNKEFEDEK